MKKLKLLVFVLMFSLFISGCFNKKTKMSCVKEYNGSYYDYEFIFQKNGLKTLTTKELTEIVLDEEVERSFEDMKKNVPIMENIYPDAKIEAVKEGKKVGIKIYFDFQKYEFDSLNLDFNANDDEKQIIDSMTNANYKCEKK